MTAMYVVSQTIQKARFSWWWGLKLSPSVLESFSETHSLGPTGCIGTATAWRFVAAIFSRMSKPVVGVVINGLLLCPLLHLRDIFLTSLLPNVVWGVAPPIPGQVVVMFPIAKSMTT